MFYKKSPVGFRVAEVRSSRTVAVASWLHSGQLEMVAVGDWVDVSDVEKRHLDG